MLIIGDWRLPESLKMALKTKADFVNFKTSGIVYDSVSGHPDIFMHRCNKDIVVAPNLPDFYLKILADAGLNLVIGNHNLGFEYPNSAFYNAICNSEYLFCNSKIIDNQILKLHAAKKIVHVNQGYVACNMVVGKNSILTSDKGISSKLGLNYFSPQGIILPEQKHGFIGGATAIFHNELWLFGSKNFISEFWLLEKFADDNELNIIELYKGPLIDGGGLVVL
jgi:hypothetical protein